MFRFWKRKPQTIVLGQQLADAREVERARIERDGTLQSPMPKGAYPTNEGIRASLVPEVLPLDRELIELCRQAAALDAESHARMSHAISMDEFYTLLAFIRRMALLAIRANSSAGLREAVEAVALIEIDRVDHRDISVALGVLAYACIRVGLDPRPLFEDASRRADHRVREILEAHARQSFTGKKLSELSFFEEVTTKYGQCFVSTGFDAYAPTVDLVSIAVGIAELLEADKYPEAGVQIATSLPTVWLRSAGEHDVRKALEGAVAGVSVSGFPSSGSQEKEQGHSILIFLVECADAVRASMLGDLALKANHSSHALIGVVEGPLFCIVIGRSIIHGVTPIETSSSLTRFALGISSTMRRALGL